ncbi:MAG TPA: CPBP family glutamic-type intramembrane protease, partial [Dongiaceae bacterium]|nr:CPBP family glutamic-type intramembrane protease [Dongiaceae bacterium]
FTDEMLFRMIVLTVALLIALRAMPAHRYWAIGLAIGASALADLVIHLPQVHQLGMPGIAMALAFALVRLAIPATLFGYLYSRRSLGTAIAAHATADLALVLLAV